MARAFYSSLFFDSGSNPVGDVLEREGGFTLEDLLDVDEVLQEAKGMNRALLDFLVKPETLATMVKYVTISAAEGSPSKQMYKHPYMCAEVICCDIPELNAALVDPELPFLASLFAILDEPAPIDCALAGYFCKIVMLLTRQKRAEMVAFLTAGGDALLAKFIAHIGSHSIAETLKCTLSVANAGAVAAESSEDGSEAPPMWGVSRSFVEGLTAVLDPHRTADEHRNASDVLASLLQPPQFGDRSVLLTHMTEPAWCDELLQRVLAAPKADQGDAPAGAGGLGSMRARALKVVLQLIETTASEAAADDPSGAAAMPACVRALATSWQPQLLACLQRAGRTMRQMQNGEIIVGAGALRILVAKLLSVILRIVVATNAEDCAAAVASSVSQHFTRRVSTPFSPIRSPSFSFPCFCLFSPPPSLLINLLLLQGIIQKCVVMIFDFPHNNILHGVIVDIIEAVLAIDAPAFGGPSDATLRPLQAAMFGAKPDGAALLNEVIDSVRDETLTETAKVGGALAHGNSGHLHRIATLVLKAVEVAGGDGEGDDALPVVAAVKRSETWEETVHGAIVTHYTAEHAFFCNIAPPTVGMGIENDNESDAAHQPAVLVAAVTKAKEEREAAAKAARGAETEARYDAVVGEADASEDVIAGMLREAQMALHLPPSFGTDGGNGGGDDEEEEEE
tara:strand:- start:485 stop:2524 length:2040 start_codon:yes stop_codon:yes gene_type:complete